MYEHLTLRRKMHINYSLHQITYSALKTPAHFIYTQLLTDCTIRMCNQDDK